MAKIIQFHESKKGLKTRFKIKNSPCNHNCRHPDFDIDEAEHEVTCARCGQKIDPFQALLAFAKEERFFIWNIEMNKAAVREFEKIKSEWSLTVREKRRIDKAMKEVRFPAWNSLLDDATESQATEEPDNNSGK